MQKSDFSIITCTFDHKPVVQGFCDTFLQIKYTSDFFCILLLHYFISFHSCLLFEIDIHVFFLKLISLRFETIQTQKTQAFVFVFQYSSIFLFFWTVHTQHFLANYVFVFIFRVPSDRRKMLFPLIKVPAALPSGAWCPWLTAQENKLAG